MNTEMNFWGDSEFSFEHEIAHGHMGRQATNRALRKHAIMIGVLSIGRNVCFKKDAAPAPAPDPAIGQAAAANAQLGQSYLDFAKQQWAAGNIRQDQYDALIGKVTNAALGSQDTANAWAKEDRDKAAALQTKYDQWATADRAAGQAAQNKFNGIADNATSTSNEYAAKMNAAADTYNATAAEQNAFAKQQTGRYNSTFAPIENRIASDAMTWDSAERQDAEAAKAKGDVVANAAQQQAAQQRNMVSMGVNPMSGRFAAGARSDAITTALGAAGAQNATRDNVRQQGIALRGQAAGVGQQVLGNANTATSLGMQATGAGLGATQSAYQTKAAGTGQAMNAITGGLAASGIGATSASLSNTQSGAGYQGLGVGLNAGSSAVGAGGAGNSNFYANNGIMGQGYNAAQQGYTNQANSLNSLYGNQINAWGMQQQANATNSAGVGNMIGSLAGTGAALYL